MTIAALVLSTVALIVAIVSARYAHDQARAATVTAQITTDRRHDELTPTFTATVEPMNHAEPYSKLHVRLDSAESLTAMTVRLVNAPIDLQFTRGQTGTDPAATFPVHTAFAVVRDGIALASHRSHAWQLEGHGWAADRLLIEVDAQTRDDHWIVAVPVSRLDGLA